MALAQDVEMNMNVQVDEDGMPNTNINIQGSDGTGAGGAHMKVKVKTSGMQQQQVMHEEEPQQGYRPPPPPQPVFRDCGTQRDPGCGMTRDGKYPMDGETWRGFYQSLKTQPNEITREEMSEKMLKRNYLTAAQLSMLLDLFPNEITRLDVAKVAAAHVVNPQHALGFSSKWQNSISAGEYTDLISEQQP
jgi:hypothetical protein